MRSETRVTLIPSDENGAEIASATKRVLAAAGVPIAFEEVTLANAVAALRETKLGLLGFQHAPHRRHEAPPIVKLRDALGMYANVRPIKTLAGLPTRHTGIDLVLVREVTEDVYRHLEHESIPGVYESLKVTTHAACERIAKHAFDFARGVGRKKVTIVHKANIMKRSDGMFLATARKVAEGYPDIAVEDVIVDALCMKLVLTPERFDVLVAGNLYGDIVADLCAGLVGGAANCPSINIGPDVRVFGAPHGVAGPADAGNPLELLMPAIELARHLGHVAEAERLRSAVEGALTAGICPVALGGDAGCERFANALIERLR